MLADYRKIPLFVYHATLFENLPSIQKHGLGYKFRADYDDPIYNQEGFFISFDYRDALEYLINNYDADKVVVLQIPEKILNPNKIYYDTNNLNNIINPTSWFYAGIIKNPRKMVRIMD